MPVKSGPAPGQPGESNSIRRDTCIRWDADRQFQFMLKKISYLHFLLILAALLSSTACGQQRPRRVQGINGEIIVRAGDDFQSAIHMAAPGETITVQAGASF